jgi:hypothetical protein
VITDRILIGCLIALAIVVGVLIYWLMVPGSPVYNG